MENLSKAIKLTNQAYIFDTSEENNKILIAEITNVESLEIKSSTISCWVDEYILNKFEIFPM